MGCGDRNCQNTDINMHGSLQCHDIPTSDVSGDDEWPKVGRRHDRGQYFFTPAMTLEIVTWATQRHLITRKELQNWSCCDAATR